MYCSLGLGCYYARQIISTPYAVCGKILDLLAHWQMRIVPFVQLLNSTMVPEKPVCFPHIFGQVQKNSQYLSHLPFLFQGGFLTPFFFWGGGAVYISCEREAIANKNAELDYPVLWGVSIASVNWITMTLATTVITLNPSPWTPPLESTKNWLSEQLSLSESPSWHFDW